MLKSARRLNGTAPGVAKNDDAAALLPSGLTRRLRRLSDAQEPTRSNCRRVVHRAITSRNSCSPSAWDAPMLASVRRRRFVDARRAFIIANSKRIGRDNLAGPTGRSKPSGGIGFAKTAAARAAEALPRRRCRSPRVASDRLRYGGSLRCLQRAFREGWETSIWIGGECGEPHGRRALPPSRNAAPS